MRSLRYTDAKNVIQDQHRFWERDTIKYFAAFFPVTPYNTHMRSRVNRRVLSTVISFTVILVGTFIAIQYAKGSIRISRDGVQQNTGLLSANSFPTGAEVFVDGKLVSATDDTLYLAPGEYEVVIAKDGFASWKKNMQIQQELVSQTNARLFPTAPTLTRLTYTGIGNTIAPSPDGQKLLYFTASQSAQRKNGLYVMDLSSIVPIALQRSPRQIAENIPSLGLDRAEFIWSPDSSELLVITENKQFLLPVDTTSDIRSLTDVTQQSKQILAEWESDMYLKEQQYLLNFPKEIVSIATQSAKNVYFSPDKEKIVYTATEPVTIPVGLIPSVPAASTQAEERTLTPGSIYVYDRQEDKNFKLGAEPAQTTTSYKKLLSIDASFKNSISVAASPSAFMSLQASDSAQLVQNFRQYHSSLYAETLQWFPDSNHLLFIQDGAIKITSYDGTNIFTLYSGPFDHSFVYPWPDGNRILMYTSFSPDAPKNLYAIELK